MAHALASASGLDASNSHVNIYDTQKSLAEMSLGALEPSFKSEDEREIQQKTQPKQDHEMLIERENQHDVEVEEGHEQQQLSDDELKFPHVEDGGEDDLTSVQVPLADSSNSQLFDKSTASLKSKSKTGSSRRESGGKPMTLKEQEEVGPLSHPSDSSNHLTN